MRIYFIFSEMRMSKFLFIFIVNSGMKQGRGEETSSGTEKRCSHNLQSGHPAWWSADSYGIFPTVKIILLDFLEAGSEPTEEIRNA